MSRAEKHQRIRETLAGLGYQVRTESGKPLEIVRNVDHVIAEAIAPRYRFRIHDDYKWYIVKVA